MADQSACSLPPYQTFMPLSGFPPARGYCSSTAFLDKSTNDNTAVVHTARDIPCPAGDHSLCDLLSDLKASDDEFTRSVWYVHVTGPNTLYLHIF